MSLEATALLSVVCFTPSYCVCFGMFVNYLYENEAVRGPFIRRLAVNCAGLMALMTFGNIELYNVENGRSLLLDIHEKKKSKKYKLSKTFVLSYE